MTEQRVLFVANGSMLSAAGERARRIADHVEFAESRVIFRSSTRARLAVEAVRSLRSWRPDLLYAVDLAVATVGAALTARPRTKVVIDTGDAPAAFMRQIGAGRHRQEAALVMERLAMRRADTVVVRGSGHVDYARNLGARTVDLVPDGVDRTVIRPVAVPELRAQLGLDAARLVLGTSGRFTWYDRLGGGLGVELVDALPGLDDVHVVLIGDGEGLERLRLRADHLGVGSRLHLLGRVPYRYLARYLSLLDVAVLTQTNDPSSHVRTTGKLPVYLAAGRFVLASRVGTAATLLPPDMLLDYDGRWDAGYSARIVDRIRDLMMHSPHPSPDPRALELSERFDYDDVAATAAGVIARTLQCAKSDAT